MLSDNLGVSPDAGYTAKVETQLDAELRESIRASENTVPILGIPMRARRDGLVLPTRLTVEKQPIDLVQVYLTAAEVLDIEPEFSWVLSTLERVEFRDVVHFSTHWLARLGALGAETDAVDRDFLAANFTPETRARTEPLLDAGRRLLVPQTLLLLVKIGLFRCGHQPRDPAAVNVLPVALLATASALGGREPSQNFADEMIGEIVANQHFNSPQSLPTTLSLFDARWFGQSPVDGRVLAADYEEVVGFNLDAVSAIALAIWSSLGAGKAFLADNQFSQLDIEPDVVAAIMDHLSAPPATFRELIVKAEGSTSWNSTPWHFSPFEQFPMLRIDGGWAVLHPKFLLDRIYAWPALLDVQQSLRGLHREADADRFLNRARSATEDYVQSSLATSFASTSDRVFDEQALRSILGSTHKVADAAIDYGHSWVVIEISTRRLLRESVHGGGALYLDHEIDALCKKAAQIDSTIKQIRAKGAALAGKEARSGQARFYPVLLLTEGYPVNPIILSRLREVLAMKHLLSGRDTAPIELMGLAALEALESFGSTGGPTMVEVSTQRISGQCGLLE